MAAKKTAVTRLTKVTELEVAATGRPSFRRKLFLINPQFQLVYLGYTLVLSVVTIAVIYFANHYFFESFHDLGRQMELPPQHAFFQFIQAQKSRMNIVFFGTSFAVIAVLSIGGLVISHRVAGPLYRLLKHMQAIADGRTTSAVKFRKGDFFPELADAFNDAMKTKRK